MKTYILPDTDLFLDLDIRKYVLRLKDLPPECQPRVKLLKQGPLSLSTSELLAIILQTGTKKEGVLEMASRVLKDYGEKALVSQRNVSKIAKDLGIPEVKASQIVACAELGRRFFEKNEIGPVLIRTAEDVYKYLKEMRSLPKEHLRGIYLNTHHRIIHDEVLSIGTINSNVIHPREVFKPAIEYGAVAVILAHNHPSGEPVPSEMDIEITKQLVEVGKIVGINLLDHLVIGRDGFKSIDVKYIN